MKKKILIGSATSATLATTISVLTALLTSNMEVVLRATGVSYSIGLLSIVLLLIGLAFPKE